MTSIVTRTGDDGLTGLVGGKRVSKDDARIHAYGTIDELNALIGAVIAKRALGEVALKQLQHVQQTLFRLGADLATPMSLPNAVPRTDQPHIDWVERQITILEKVLPPLDHFILPGGTETASLLHVARTVCRRAERWIVSLQAQEPLSPHALVYVNRLGDYLFLLARSCNRSENNRETAVSYEEKGQMGLTQDSDIQ